MKVEGDLRGASFEAASETVVAPSRPDEIDLDLEEAFEHRAELTEVCRRIVGDTALAEDVVQETYLQAVRNLHKLERRDGLMPWLVTVATRRSLNELRRRKYSTPVDVMPERTTAPEADPCMAVTLSDEFDRVNSIMSTLTGRERDLLMRQVYDGMSLAELAEMEHSSPASVRSVLNRARAKIKAAIADSGARILLPFTLVLDRIRRRLEPAFFRFQQFDAVAPAAMRPAEAVAAGVIGLVLVLGGSGPDGLQRVDAGRSPAADDDGATDGIDAGIGDAGSPTEGVGGGAGGRGVAPRRDAQGAVDNDSGTGPSGGETGQPSPLPPIDPIGPPPVDPVETPDPFPSASDPEDTDGEDVKYAQGGGSDDGPGTLFFAGTTQGQCTVRCTALFSSTDGGATWVRLPARGLNATSLMLPPSYPDDPRIFAMGSTGLQVSTDGGATFGPVAGMAYAGPAAISPAFSKGDPRILVGSTPPWEYDDSTGTARPIAGAPVGPHETTFAFAPDYADSGLLFAGAATVEDGEVVAGVHTCTVTLGNDTCRRMATLPGVSTVPKVAVSSSFADDHTVFAWARGGAFRSVNAGRTFHAMEMPFATIVKITDDGWGTFYAAGYTTGETSTVGGVARSRDGGRTWTLLGAGSPVGRGAKTVIALGGGHLIAAPVSAAGGGVFCSVDDGATWATRCPAPTPRTTTITAV